MKKTNGEIQKSHFIENNILKLILMKNSLVNVEELIISLRVAVTFGDG